MRQKQTHLIILAVVAALMAVSAYYIWPPGEKTHLGLDLQGGLEVVYNAKLPNGQAPNGDQMDKTISIIDRRVNGLGVTESAVQRQGPTQISIGLPGVSNVDQALNIIGKTAQLQFFDDGKQRVAGPAPSAADAFKQARTAPLVPLTAEEKAALKLLEKGQPTDKLALVQAGAAKYSDNAEAVYFVYKLPASMTGEAIKDARQGYDQVGKANVLMDFTSEGGKQFEKVTKDLALRGTIKGEPQSFAIVLDNQMESDPVVDPQQNPNGISGGKAEITGNFTVGEAKDLALVLNTGALPVTLEKIQSQEVSATLGKDSLRQGLFAGVIGLGLILVYLVVYYRFLGLVADLALIVYAVLLWGLFNAIPVTLTLPGIAGMILTIGVAADANVIIFERIKEEVRRGRTVRSAINSGYSRGFRTILDANILTLLTAIVLFEFATAQPKGFAFTLILGVLVSMFTAVLATRALLGLMSDFTFFNRASFMGVKAGDIVAEAEPERGGRGSRRSRARAAAPATEGDDDEPVAAPAKAAPGPSRPARPRRQSTARKKKKRKR